MQHDFSDPSKTWGVEASTQHCWHTSGSIPRGEDPHPQCRKGCGPVFQSLSFRTSKPSREVSWLLDTTSDRRPWAAAPAHSAHGAPRRPTELVSHGLLRPWTLQASQALQRRELVLLPSEDGYPESSMFQTVQLVPFPIRCVYHRPNVSPALLITS